MQSKEVVACLYSVRLYRLMTKFALFTCEWLCKRSTKMGAYGSIIDTCYQAIAFVSADMDLQRTRGACIDLSGIIQ